MFDRDMPAVLETPQGKLYRPWATGAQIAALAAAFFGGPLAAWLLGQAIGVTELAQTVLYAAFVLVFFLGYAAWTARLNALAFATLGRGLLKGLFSLLIRRRKPESLEEIIPSKEALLAMAVKAQRAGWLFFWCGLPLAGLAGLTAVLFDSPTGPFARLFGVTGALAAWAWLLGFAARRGYLPMAEGE